MIVTKDTHSLIELTSWETMLLKDLLKAVGDENPTLSKEHDRLRTDLLYHLSVER